MTLSEPVVESKKVECFMCGCLTFNFKTIKDKRVCSFCCDWRILEKAVKDKIKKENTFLYRIIKLVK